MKIILYLLFFITSPAFTTEPKPDIVFIIVDDLNDWVGVIHVDNSDQNRIIMHQHFLDNNYRVVSGGKIAHGGPGGAIPKAKLDAKLPLQGTRIPKDKILRDKRNLWGDVGSHCLEEEKTGDYKVAQWAIKQWNTPSQKPLFMTIGFHRPHRPLNIPKKYFDKFSVDKVKLPVVQKDD